MYRERVEGQLADPAGRDQRLTVQFVSFFSSIHGLFAMKTWSSSARTTAIFLLMLTVFLLAFFLPFAQLPTTGALPSASREALLMLQDYAQHHVILCLIPALFIAGAIACFVSQAAVIKYFGARAHKAVAYSVAAVSGTILAACSCTILPLFAGIYKRGAGLGPATAFLYSGPAINVLAIILTARVLGWELGLARAIGAVVFAVAIGLAMHLIYRKEEAARSSAGKLALPDDEKGRSLGLTALYFAALIGVLVFANWARPSEYTFTTIAGDKIQAVVVAVPEPGTDHAPHWRLTLTAGATVGEELLLPQREVASFTPVPSVMATLWRVKWVLTGLCLLGVVVMNALWFTRTELHEWFASTWSFAKLILPLLFVGVLVAGLLLGRPGHPALIPESWIAGLLGGNGLGANLFAAVAGALMYFATLTEVPIIEGLLGAGMGRGPALALLLAGPALSLPNMLVIRSVMGTQKTVVYVVLVVVLSTTAGLIYGSYAA